ncbi:hypothetical protein [Streptomyces mirabilis]|uniref:hypothetical protein n=1 Tax=Streptomyces mirabilis TaxID=68239 RepID=UPI00364C676E
MGAELADYGPKPTTAEPDELVRAAVRIADQFGKEHPHPQDDENPRQAGWDLCKDPAIAAGFLELAAALGLEPDRIRRAAHLPLAARMVDALRRRYIRLATAYIADLEAEVAVKRERTYELIAAADFADSDAAGYIDRTGLENAS